MKRIRFHISTLLLSLTAIAMVVSPLTAFGFGAATTGHWECMMKGEPVELNQDFSVVRNCCVKHQQQSDDSSQPDPTPCSNHACCIMIGCTVGIVLPSPTLDHIICDEISVLSNTSDQLTLPGWHDPLLRPPIL